MDLTVWCDRMAIGVSLALTTQRHTQSLAVSCLDSAMLRAPLYTAAVTANESFLTEQTLPRSK